jgi:hypothetical protein
LGETAPVRVSVDYWIAVDNPKLKLVENEKLEVHTERKIFRKVKSDARH